LFTSLAENQPLTVLESLRAGNPVFVFATGGAADLMQEVSGLFLSPSLDTDQVINEIINFHSSDRLKKEILIPSEKYLSLSVHTNLILNLYRSTPS
jgi:glycosyltransferase involved in cell wall biosynthesis